MPLTEEEEMKMWDFIVKGKHNIFEDVVEYMKPEVGIHKILANLPKTRWFIGFEYCQHCHKQMIVTRQYTERKFCCKEHRIQYHNENRNLKKCICEYCGRVFHTYTFRNSRFCTRECAAYAREAAKRAKKAEQNS